jgi:hypothetical protein
MSRTTIVDVAALARAAIPDDSPFGMVSHSFTGIF